jgi:DegV family protein with EDD domain
MERDRHVAVVTDSGTSMLPDSPEAKDLGVTVVPLDIQLWNGKEYISYPENKIDTKSFYEQMRTSNRLPLTSGSVIGRLTETFEDLRKRYKSIVSINITSKHSAVYDSAVAAKDIVLERLLPETQIEILDSKFASIASWFPVETAALSAKKGASISQVCDDANEVIGKTELLVALETLENLRRGGRGKEFIQAIFASILKITPIIGFENGFIKRVETARSPEKARQSMLELVGSAGNLVKLAVIHTNAKDLAERMKMELISRKIFKGEIPIYEARAALAVHAAAGAVAFAFQKA